MDFFVEYVIITETETSSYDANTDPSKCPHTCSMYSRLELNVNCEKIKITHKK